jgi:hypothetical protein
MKNLFFALATVIAILSAISISSCKKDAPPPNQQFLGTYNGVMACSGNATDQWIVTAQPGSSTAIYLYNASAFGVQLSGTVSGNNLTIPYQFIAIDSATFHGSGAITGSQLVLTVLDNYGDDCDFTGVK